MKTNEAPLTMDKLTAELKAMTAKRSNIIAEYEKAQKDREAQIALTRNALEKGNLTPDEYVKANAKVETLTAELDQIKKALAEQEALRAKLNGFMSEEDRTAFRRRLNEIYTQDEGIFLKDAEKHLYALKVLLDERDKKINDVVIMAQQINAMDIIKANPTSRAVAQLCRSLSL